MTRSEMPSVVRRKTSLTIRHRFTPAITFSTTTRALEMRELRNLSATLNSRPLGFFWGGRRSGVGAACLPRSCLADRVRHRPPQRPAAHVQTLRASVRSRPGTLAACLVRSHRLAYSKYTLSPIMSITFHLHKGVKWHDGVPFSSADVKYTVERIMNPPEGMVSPRGPVFKALIERVEAPDPDTVVVYGKGPSKLLFTIFASGHNVIIPKHIVEKDPVNALKSRVIGTGPFRLKELPTTTLWKYERNPDYFKKGQPFLDEIEIHIITDPQALVAAMLSKRIYWSDVFPHANLDRDLAKSTAQQNPSLIHTANPGLVVSHLTLQTEKPPLNDLRVRQAISEAVKREAIGELGNQSGAVGTGNYPVGLWPMPKEMRQQLIGYGPDMAKRIAHAKEFLAAYEKEKGKIDWSKIKLQCATTIKFSCENSQVVQQLLKKININVELEPMLFSQLRANEVSGNYWLSILGAAIDFDDPIDTFGQWFVTKGGRWYQRHSLPEVDKLYEEQKFIADPEARKKVIWEMDQLAINDAAYLILHWFDLHHVRWDFVKGWTITPDIRSTNARMDYVWIDLKELPHTR